MPRTKQKNYNMVIELLQTNMPLKQIAIETGYSYSSVRKIKSDNKKLLNQKIGIVNTNIDNFEYDLEINLKKIIIYISNILTDKNLLKESSPQLLKTLGTAFDKLQLLKGKSTEIITIKQYDELDKVHKDMIDKLNKEYENKTLH